MKGKGILGLIMTLGLAVSIAGCEGSGGTKATESTQPTQAAPPAQAARKRVAVVTPHMSAATTKYVIERFKAAAEAKGWEVSVTDTAGDFSLQVSRIEDAVAQKADAIVLGMGDPTQITKGMESAQRAGIPVFGLDAGVAPGVVANVTSDNTDMGKTTAEALIKEIGGKGTILIYTYDQHFGVRERAVAAEAVFKANASITILEKKHIHVPGQLEDARKITEDLLAKHPGVGSISGIWAGWDEPAMGAVQAIQAAHRTEIKVVGIDGMPFAKAEVAKGGPLFATDAQDFDGMATDLVKLMEGYFQGQKPADPWHKIPGKLLTRENVQP